MAAKTTYDRDKVTELRMELIEAGLAIMKGKKEVERWSQLKKDFVIKVGSRALPILNAGKDDESDLFPQPILNGLSGNNGNKKIAGAKKENS